jgi:hypothetical protein
LPPPDPTPVVTPGPTPSPVPTLPARANGRIIFTGDRDLLTGSYEIYSTAFTGGGATNLTSNSATDFNPSVSRNTGRIAFTSRLADVGDDNNEIYVMNADGSNQLRLTNDPQQARTPVDDHEPTISPDGQWVVFTSMRDGNANLYIIPTRLDPDGTVPEAQPLTSSPASDDKPVFSMDGKHIAFVSDRDGNNEIYRLTLNISGSVVTASAETRLTTHPADDRDPTVGPPSQAYPMGRIVWASTRPELTAQSNDFDLYIMSLLGPETGAQGPNPPVRITDSDLYNYTILPQRSYYIPGASETLSTNFFYGTFLPIPFDRTGDEIQPSFSPDGTRIAFATNTLYNGSGDDADPYKRNYDNDFEIHTISPDSRGDQIVTDNKPVRTRNDDKPPTGYKDINFARDVEPTWGPALAAAAAASAGSSSVAAKSSTTISAKSSKPGTSKGEKNKAPHAVHDNVTTVKDTPIAIVLQGKDSDGDALTYEIVRQPVNGTLSGDGANVTYTPNAGFVGKDEFTFRVFDGKAYSSSATIKIKVVESGKTKDKPIGINPPQGGNPYQN